MPETIRLARPYIQVKRKQIGTLTCGGDQNFFAGAREGSKDFRKQKLGCGITALSDVFLYFAKREGAYRSRETEGYVKSCLTEDEYRDYYNRIYRFVGGIAPWARNGLSFLRIQGSFNRMARRQKWKLRARWGFGFRKMRGRIEEMLRHDLPVILCIPFMVFKRDKGQGIIFYEKRDGKYQKFCKVSAHYVVILGITEQKEREFMKKYSMLTDSPGKSLFFFALPMILGNLFQQFYSAVDSIIVGQFVGEEALAAVGASYSLTTVFIMIAIGGGIGASVIISQYLGAGLFKKMKTSVHTALISFLSVSIILGIAGLLLSRSILTALNTPENILSDALLYLDIYFVGLPFLFMYNILSSVFNALGNSKTPLYLLIFSSLFNIVMDLVFVRGMGLGIGGAAVATVLAQGISAVVSFCLLMHALKEYGAEKEEIEEENGSGLQRFFDVQMLGNMIKVAIPSMLQQSIVSIGMLLVQSVVNGYGSSVLAGYTAGTRIESICIVPMIASGNAVSTFTAQNLGAGHPERVKKGYLAAVRMVAAFAVMLCLILTFFHGNIINAFLEEGSEPIAFETGNSYLSFIAFFFVCIGLKAITDGVLRGAGDVVVFTLANLINLGIRVTVAFALSPVWGVQAVWFAVPMGWTTNFVISFVRYLSGKWSGKKLIKV